MEDLLTQLGRPYQELYERFGSRHAELLNAVEGDTKVRLVADSCGESRWVVSIAAVDAPGVLAIIAGLFAGYRIDIRNGDVFSLRPTPDETRVSGKILDVFEVITSAWVDDAFWTGLEVELAELFVLLVEDRSGAAVEQVILRLSESLAGVRQSDDPLYPVTVSVENRDDASATELRLHSSDTPAFLCEFANALTFLGVNIERVKIRTLYGEARDSEEKIHELRVATALIKQFAHLLPQSANPAQALQQFTKFTSDVLSRPDWTATLEPLGSGDVLRTLADMMGVSSFLWEDFLRLQHENLFPVLSDVPGLEIARSRESLDQEFAAELEGADGDEAARILNQIKDREMFRIDLRHLTRRIGMEEFSTELTALAEATIAAAADLCWKAQEERFGAFPRPWCILGAGKLGGRELGFASDIEVVFVCDPGEDADPELKARFETFAQKFVKTLAARQNGVFEIDLRLRPYGESAPLTSTLETFRGYYAEDGQAQHFERMSLVKLRPIAGDSELGQRVEAIRDAFAYSGAPADRDNIRHLRGRQVEETVKPGQTNAKLSPGGLVDVEYYVQACQLEAGAAHPEVRTTNTLDAIARLAEQNCLTERNELDGDLAQRIGDSYRFLRRLIDALRVVRGNAKDITIPPVASQEFGYLSRRLGYGSPEALQRDVEQQMAVARDLWA
jgi:glutamate-ammonia-ligase adenylyltransferase